MKKQNNSKNNSVKKTDKTKVQDKSQNRVQAQSKSKKDLQNQTPESQIKPEVKKGSQAESLKEGDKRNLVGEGESFVDLLHKKATMLIELINGFIPLLLLQNFWKTRDIGPYLRLMRLDKLTGFWLVFFPALWAVIMAMRAGAGFFNSLYYIILIAAGALFARGAGCVINDLLDVKIDKEVGRTKSRPLASGELDVWQALLFLLILALACAVILLAFSAKSIKIALFAILLIALYPLSKRVMRAPQLFLSLTFNSGIFIAWFALQPNLTLVPLFLFSASIFWTIGYDTIYALQDLRYDKNLDIGSTAKLFSESTASFIWKVYKIHLLLLLVFAVHQHFSFGFYLIYAVACYHLYWQINSLDQKNEAGCMYRFNSNVIYGLLISLALLAS